MDPYILEKIQNTRNWGGIAQCNYTTSIVHNGIGTVHELSWAEGNTYASEGVAFSRETVAGMMQAIQNHDFDDFEKDRDKLPWLDRLLGNPGVIPDDIHDETNVNTVLSRGSALYMYSNVPSELGFVGSPYYADTLGKSSMYTIALSGLGFSEQKEERRNYPSHMLQRFSSPNGLIITQRKFISFGNTAVTLLEFQNTSDAAITFDVSVSSPFVSRAVANELVGDRIASPLMVGISGVKYVEAMSSVDVRINGTGMVTSSSTLKRTLTIPAGETATQKVVMGWLAKEIPQSYSDYDVFTAAGDVEAFTLQVTSYNEWWANNIPYIDIPDQNVKKILYYRWWCNRYNFLQANIPGNDWQFPMNMEGVTGYNNGITVSVAWAMRDIKWLRDPSYVYGTWLSQGEYSAGTNYKNNPGRPNIWTWDMMQNISDVGWSAYKIHGGGQKILRKFAGFADADVFGSLKHFSANSNSSLNDSNLIYYNHGPITGNDGDTVSMHWNTSAGNLYARIDGSSTIYANAIAAGHMYDILGDHDNADRMYAQAAAIRKSMLQHLWFDGNDFDGDGVAETNGTGSFLHVQASTGLYVPWRDNNMFAFSMRVVPVEGEDAYDPKYKTQLFDYGDDRFYPVFPFFTADQTSIEKRIQAWINDEANAYGTNQFAWCNFGNYINILTASLRHYPVPNITTDLYSKLFDWGAWMHTVIPGDTSYLDANEFFWLTGYFFGTQWTKDNPPSSTGNVVRSWIHHDTLGMLNYTVIEDMAGLQPRSDDKIELWPLGVAYDHFAVDNIRYHGADLTIVWQDPTKYTDENPFYPGLPVGYSLYINGLLAMNNSDMSHVIFDTASGKVQLPSNDVEGTAGSNANTIVKFQVGDSSLQISTALDSSLANNYRMVDVFNKAGIDIEHDSENLVAAEGTTIEFSYINPGSRADNLANGSTAVAESPADNLHYYTSSFEGTPNSSDSVTFTFPQKIIVDQVKIHFYNDRMVAGYTAPLAYGVEYLDDNGVWLPVTGQERYPEVIASNYNSVSFKAVNTTAIRVNITHATNGFSTAVTELLLFNNNLGITDQDNHNQPPQVSLPADLTAETETRTTIIPDVYDDGIPTGVLTFHWEFVEFEGTGDGSCEIVDPSAKDLTAIFDTAGKYIFNYTVSDGDLDTKTVVEVIVTVSTSELLALIAKFSDTQYLTRNAADYESQSWAALQSEIARIQAILDAGGYNSTVINDCIASLQAYISDLEYVNIALLAEPSTNYVSTWESLAAVNDGFIPLGAGKNEDIGDYAYGNWGGPYDTYWVQYRWEKAATIRGASVYFYNDFGGVQNPGEYWYEGFDANTGNWVRLETVEGSAPNTIAAYNDVTFTAEVTTTAIRIQMTKAGDSIWNGIRELRIIGTYESDTAPIEGDIVSFEPVTVHTTVGVIPEMPAKVLATYSSGQKALVAVTWPDLANYVSTATTHTVEGTVQETTLMAICYLVVSLS